MADELYVGATVYKFDENARVYARDKEGRRFGNPLRRPSWVPKTIVGQTSRSWIVGEHEWEKEKLPKKGPRKHGWAYSLKEVEDDVWLSHNRYKLKEAVGRATVDQLREVARIIGYESVYET
jgi:hypothetical protein